MNKIALLIEDDLNGLDRAINAAKAQGFIETLNCYLDKSIDVR